MDHRLQAILAVLERKNVDGKMVTLCQIWDIQSEVSDGQHAAFKVSIISSST